MTTEAPPITYEVHVLCDLWTANRERSMHWTERDELVGFARMMAKQAAQQAHVPHLEAARIIATPQQARGRLADPGNHYPAVKACIDGLVDAGVLDDDRAPFIVEIVQRPAVKTALGAVGIVLEIESALIPDSPSATPVVSVPHP